MAADELRMDEEGGRHFIVQYRQNANVPEGCSEGWPLPMILTQQRPSNASDAAETWKAFSCLMADPV